MSETYMPPEIGTLEGHDPNQPIPYGVEWWTEQYYIAWQTAGVGVSVFLAMDTFLLNINVLPY